jgi:hypothetical protein
MSQERISVEQVAKRAGVSTQNIQRFVEAKLLVPEDGHSFGVTAVTLARLLASIEAAGIPARSRGCGRAGATLVRLPRRGAGARRLVCGRRDVRRSLQVDRYGPRGDGAGDRGGGPAASARERPHPAGGPGRHRGPRGRPRGNATKDPLVVFRFLRVLGDGLRRIAEVEAHAYQHAFEGPLLRSGMDEREMRQVVSQRSPELEAMAERILLWLSRRHRDHQTVDHLISHVEDAMDPALFDFERQKSPPAIGFLDLTGTPTSPRRSETRPRHASPRCFGRSRTVSLPRSEAAPSNGSEME